MIATHDKITSARLSVPFYPMRPRHSANLNRENLNSVFEDGNLNRYVIQGKLNGDRAVLAVDSQGEVHVTNRHGGFYKMTVSTSEFADLPEDTILDGEIYKKKFYPFDIVAYDGRKLLFTPAAERLRLLKNVCESHDIEYIFDVTLADLQERIDGDMWEGVVLKEADSPYIMLSSETQNSDTWTKRKW